MRLIDADALIEAMGEEPYVWTDSADEIAERNQWLTDMHIIESAPNIDIVFCKECEHYEDGRCESDEMWGSIFGYTTECEYISRNDDDFCSFGEAKGKGESRE